MLRDGELVLTTRLAATGSEGSKTAPPSDRSGTPVCSGCSAFKRASRRYRPELEPPNRGTERGAPNCSKCSPFRLFAPKPLEERNLCASVRLRAPRAPDGSHGGRSLGGSDPLFLGAGPPKTLPASPRVAPAQTSGDVTDSDPDVRDYIEVDADVETDL